MRHDGDDPYLVVAADKGTATFSDIANGIAEEYGFWLGDAFASGGSDGYDHKAMGITARGAWELVKRHFRELGTDIQASDFTCVGVGDMSGDVFGNGMLRSAAHQAARRLRPPPHLPRSRSRSGGELRRAPAPVRPAALVLGRLRQGADLQGRRRLRAQPRNRSRSRPRSRARLGIEAEHLTPAELIQAILKAPVDLLWFGGIGTYRQGRAARATPMPATAPTTRSASTARTIRAKVVGEGANLGVTQRGRIEYALKGGRINTDAIDNSAGVDTSDHEVNIKILLNAAVAGGRSDAASSATSCCTRMTDEVAALVLRDNYLQGLALSLAEAHERPTRFDRAGAADARSGARAAARPRGRVPARRRGAGGARARRSRR